MFCLHNAMTKIGKVRIMSLFAAYFDIVFFPVSQGCYFKKFTCYWIDQRASVAVSFLFVAVMFLFVTVKFL